MFCRHLEPSSKYYVNNKKFKTVKIFHLHFPIGPKETFDTLPFPSLDQSISSINEPHRLKGLFKKLNEVLENNQEIGDDGQSMHVKCQYMDINEFKSSKFNSVNTLSFFHLNVASLSHNFEGLHAILASLEFDFDVIGISETRIKISSSITSNLHIKNYHFENNPTESSAGGTGLYISTKLAYIPRSDLCMYKAGELESTFIEIIYNNSPNVIVGCVYRHPCMSLEEFNADYSSQLFEKLATESNKKVFLMGDFNVDLLKSNDHSESSVFLEQLESNNLMPQILLPTRLTDHSRTLIDNIFSNSIGSDNISGNLTCTVSDHLPQFLIVNNMPKTMNKDHNIFIRNMRGFNQGNFMAELQNINWGLLDIERGDIDHSMGEFLSIFNDLLNKHAPLKKATRKELERQQKPWITKGILCSMRKRDIIFRQFKNCSNPIRKTNLHNKYKIYRNQIASLIKGSKKNHMANFFSLNKKNCRKIWEGIRSVVNIKTSSKFFPSCLITDGKNCTDPVDIANSFNRFFSSIGKKVQNSVYSEHVRFSDYLNNPCNDNFFTTPTCPKEVSELISTFQKNKASGPNSIPNNLLQMVKDIIAHPLSDMINLSFQSGTYPHKMKIAKIMPVHKKGSRLNVDNYRPISLLSNINKIFEKLMYKRVYKFLSLKGTFFEMQFGFREKHSTLHALISLTETIRNALDNNEFVCGIFIDLKKAFDTVDHEILLNKLGYYGIRGLPNEWFRSYLTGRKQFVSINGYNSKVLECDIGVPQGSVLGPLLFLIYINDLHQAMKNSLVHHFADDTNLLHINKSLSKLNSLLNRDLKYLCNWLKANKIALNTAKTEMLFFRSPNRPFIPELNLKIDGKPIIPSQSVKYLGVYLDEFLSFKPHINELSSKLRRCNGILAKIRHFVPFETLRSIYFSIFESHLIYCCAIWGQKGNSLIDRIISLQNSALRIITFSDFRASSTPLYINLNILQFRQQIELQNALFVNSTLNSLNPLPFSNMFAIQGDIHDHATRNPLYLVRNNVRTTRYGINSIKYQCIHAWNKFVDHGLICLEKWPITNACISKSYKSHCLDH